MRFNRVGTDKKMLQAFADYFEKWYVLDRDINIEIRNNEGIKINIKIYVSDELLKQTFEQYYENGQISSLHDYDFEKIVSEINSKNLETKLGFVIMTLMYSQSFVNWVRDLPYEIYLPETQESLRIVSYSDMDLALYVAQGAKIISLGALIYSLSPTNCTLSLGYVSFHG